MNLNVADFNTGTKTPAKVKSICTIFTEEITLYFNNISCNLILILFFSTDTKCKIRTGFTKDRH